MSHTTSDAQLIALCLRGQRQAWDILVERYLQLVCAVAAKRGLTGEPANAVCLAVCGALHDRLAALGDEPRLSRWVIAATEDECRRAQPEGASADLDESTQAMLAKQYLIRLGAAELAERCQEVLRLWCYAPSRPNTAELARGLQLAPEQISSTRARCLRYLQYALNRLDYPWPRPEGAPTSVERSPGARPCARPLEHWVDYVEGDLDEHQRRTLQAHLAAGCDHCRAELAWVMELLPAMHADDAPLPSEALLAQAQALYRPPQAPPKPHRWQPLAQEQPATRQRHVGRLLLGFVLALLVGLGMWTLWGYQWRPETGFVTRVERGALAAQGAADAPWVAAPEGQVLGQGYAIRSARDTVATITFAGASTMRVERGGEWLLVDLAVSRNLRLSRVAVRQKLGRASYVSAQHQRGRTAQLRITTEEGALDLSGVATITCSAAEGTRIELLQGRATLEVAGKRVSLAAGQTAVIAPQKTITIIGQPPQ